MPVGEVGGGGGRDRGTGCDGAGGGRRPVGMGDEVDRPTLSDDEVDRPMLLLRWAYGELVVCVCERERV